MVEMILENSKKLVESGMEVNEVIKANVEFFKTMGASSGEVTKLEITLKFNLDEDFKAKYEDFIFEQVSNEM